MSKARKAVKYTTAGAVTALYGGAVYMTVTGMETGKPEPRKVVTAAGILIGMTWLATLL